MPSSPGSGRPVKSHHAWMCLAFLARDLRIFSCISHQLSHVSTSLAGFVHLIFVNTSGKSFGIVFGKHSTI